MTRAARVVALLAGLALAAPMASAYYHWVFFAQRGGPFTPIRMRFDLNALPNQTVPFFVSSQGPSVLVEGDSFEALLSQIRLAADSWNQAESSALRLQFGGLGSTPEGQSTPGIDVVFDDEMPPGVLAQTLPVTVQDLSYLGQENSPGFAPIVRAKLQLRSDLTVKYQPSYSDAFFTTIVHEFGHTVGLQHSMTSAAMSTAITRATTKARPLSEDDVAAISLLYPTEGFAASTGVIAGRVVSSGNGVNLASVVALSATGAAIGGMTNPDGTYRIEGLPPGQYRVYAHPLPPAQSDEGYPAAIEPPRDLVGEPFPAATNIETLFFPGTRDWAQAAVLDVAAGGAVEAVDFNLQARPGPAIHSMKTYGYLTPTFGTDPIRVDAPPFPSGLRTYIVFSAPGLYVPGTTQLVPGLSLRVIGGPARLEPETLAYWNYGFSLIVLNTDPVERPTPVALAVTTPNDLYVRPAAFTVVPADAPRITSITRSLDTQGQEQAIVTGRNLNAATRVLFDGAPGTIQQRLEDGRLVVTAPPAEGTHQAFVTALGDTQSSGQFVLGPPPQFGYDTQFDPALAVSGEIVAGGDALLEIDGARTNFLNGQTVVGIGTSDVAVAQMWIINRNRLLVNLSVNPAVRPGLADVTAVSGLQLAAGQVAIQPGVQNQAGLKVPVTNAETGLSGVPSGGIAFIRTVGLPADLSGWSIFIGGIRTEMTAAEGGIRAAVPSGLPIGPVRVQLAAPDGRSIPPVFMQVDPPPPVILRIAAGTNATGTAGALGGESVKLTVAGLGDDVSPVTPANVDVRVAGVRQTVAAVRIVPQAFAHELEFVLRSDTPEGTDQAVTVRVGTRQSAPAKMTVRPREIATPVAP